MSSSFKHFRTQPQLVLAALGVIAAVSVGYTVGRIGHAPEKAFDRPRETTTPAGADGFKPGQGSVSQSVRKETPLPPAGTPLSSTFDTLRRLSVAGGAKAARRLFDDLTVCSEREKNMRWLSSRTFSRSEGIRRFGPSPFVDKSIEESLAQLDASDALCDGVTPEQIDARGEELRRAAMLGDAAALVCYAESPLNRSPKYLSNAWFDYVDRWKVEAPEFARRAFDAGQANVIPLLVDAYAPQNGEGGKSFEFGQLIAPDPRLAYAMTLLYARLVPEAEKGRVQASADGLGVGLTSNELDEAQRFVDREWPRFASQAGNIGNTEPCSGVTYRFNTIKEWIG
jgi:hypothetical protein